MCNLGYQYNRKNIISQATGDGKSQPHFQRREGLIN